MKTYRVELTQEEVEIISQIFNVAVKAQGLVGNIDIAARNILNKIAEGEVKEDLKNKEE